MLVQHAAVLLRYRNLGKAILSKLIVINYVKVVLCPTSAARRKKMNKVCFTIFRCLYSLSCAPLFKHTPRAGCGSCQDFISTAGDGGRVRPCCMYVRVCVSIYTYVQTKITRAGGIETLLATSMRVAVGKLRYSEFKTGFILVFLPCTDSGSPSFPSRCTHERKGCTLTRQIKKRLPLFSRAVPSNGALV